MGKNKNDRKDSLLIDSGSRDIKYFIFSYKPYLIKHYLLFKNIGNDTFEYILESNSFNAIFASKELLDIKYKNASEFTSKTFEKTKYDNYFISEYLTFEEDEAFDEEIQSELEVVVIDYQKIRKEELLKDTLKIMKQNKYPLDIGVTIHGKERILERIGQMDDNEILSLAKVAYEKGLNSIHFIEKDTTMFKFLQYHQNKKNYRKRRRPYFYISVPDENPRIRQS